MLLLDDINGWWPASGTALHLAKQRHQVTIATAAEKAAGALDNSATGDTTRERFAKHGIEVLLATALEVLGRQHGDADESLHQRQRGAASSTPWCWRPPTPPKTD